MSPITDDHTEADIARFAGMPCKWDGRGCVKLHRSSLEIGDPVISSPWLVVMYSIFTYIYIFNNIRNEILPMDDHR